MSYGMARPSPWQGRLSGSIELHVFTVYVIAGGRVRHCDYLISRDKVVSNDDVIVVLGAWTACDDQGEGVPKGIKMISCYQDLLRHIYRDSIVCDCLKLIIQNLNTAHASAPGIESNCVTAIGETVSLYEDVDHAPCSAWAVYRKTRCWSRGSVQTIVNDGEVRNCVVGRV